MDPTSPVETMIDRARLLDSRAQRRSMATRHMITALSGSFSEAPKRRSAFLI